MSVISRNKLLLSCDKEGKYRRFLIYVIMSHKLSIDTLCMIIGLKWKEVIEIMHAWSSIFPFITMAILYTPWSNWKTAELALSNNLSQYFIFMIIISSSIKLFLSSTYFYIFMICEKYTRVRYFLTFVYFLPQA